MAGLKIPDNFLYYLSLHEDCNERLLARAGNLTPEDVEVCIHPEVARIKKMVYAVLGEAHRMKAFVRLQPLGARVLYGFFKPRHRIGEHICDTLARRNAGIIVVLGNGSESWISLCREGRIWRDHSGGMAITLEKLKAALHCSEDGSSEADLQDLMWRASGRSTTTASTARRERIRRHFTGKCPEETRIQRDCGWCKIRKMPLSITSQAESK